jgi:methylene-fatty-acyl-phospholipid synthase
VALLAGAAVLLSLERIFYIWLTRDAESFAALCRRVSGRADADPVRAVAMAFYGFKALQLGVFAVWWWVFTAPGSWTGGAGPAALAFGAALVIAGQALSLLVFWRIGRTGVFYGGQLGRPVAWQRGFPFSRLRHPQYVGAVMSIWGLFLVIRFPAPDWVALPALETVYYAASAILERYES